MAQPYPHTLISEEKRQGLSPLNYRNKTWFCIVRLDDVKNPHYLLLGRLTANGDSPLCSSRYRTTQTLLAVIAICAFYLSQLNYSVWNWNWLTPIKNSNRKMKELCGCCFSVYYWHTMHLVEILGSFFDSFFTPWNLLILPVFFCIDAVNS